MRYRFTRLAALLFLVPVALAVVTLPLVLSANMPVDTQSQMIRAQLRLALADSSERFDTLYFFNNNEWQTITLTGLSISAPIEYNGPPQLLFYASLPDAVVPPTPIARHVIEGDNQLLLLFPDSTAGQRYRIYALQDDNRAFPAQSILLLNFSRERIAVSCGGAVKQVPSDSKALVHHNSNGSSTLQIRIASHDSNADAWELVRSTALATRGKNRRWLIVWRGRGENMLIFMDRSSSVAPPAVANTGSLRTAL